MNIRVTSNELQGPPFEDSMVGLFEKSFGPSSVEQATVILSPITCHDNPKRKEVPVCLEEDEPTVSTRFYDIELEVTDEDGNVTSTTCSVAILPDDGCDDLDEYEQQYYHSLTRNVISSLTLEWDTSLDTSMIPSIAYDSNAWEGTRKGRSKKKRCKGQGSDYATIPSEKEDDSDGGLVPPDIKSPQEHENKSGHGKKQHDDVARDVGIAAGSILGALVLFKARAQGKRRVEDHSMDESDMEDNDSDDSDTIHNVEHGEVRKVGSGGSRNNDSSNSTSDDDDDEDDRSSTSTDSSIMVAGERMRKHKSKRRPLGAFLVEEEGSQGFAIY